jgi:hypothetical protein
MRAVREPPVHAAPVMPSIRYRCPGINTIMTGIRDMTMPAKIDEIRPALCLPSSQRHSTARPSSERYEVRLVDILEISSSQERLKSAALPPAAGSGFELLVEFRCERRDHGGTVLVTLEG